MVVVGSPLGLVLELGKLLLTFFYFILSLYEYKDISIYNLYMDCFLNFPEMFF